ncbi:hypothetical protein KW798_03510, partial [Candidatus Parcubacteria bacterium]|nr:hypothetical protein [Candidatus Parcubacteria bacterium]
MQSRLISLVALALGIFATGSFGLSVIVDRLGSPESPFAAFFVESLASTLIQTGVILLVSFFLL